MRKLSIGTGVAILLFGALVSAPAQSDRGMPQPGHSHGSQVRHHQQRVFVFVGAPIFWAWYYAPAAAYDAQIDPASFYIAPMNGSYAPPPAATYLYFCAESNAYYPYAAECFDGWQLMVPTPPP
jgi:hypothetical protein